jgi:hypothetical protein
MAHHYAIDASDLIAEVVDLEATLSLYLHLLRSPLYKVLNHLCSGKEVVNQLRVLWVAHLWHSSDGFDKIRGHMDLLSFDPSEEGITVSPVQVGVELSNQLLYHWTMVFHHLNPTLGL